MLHTKNQCQGLVTSGIDFQGFVNISGTENNFSINFAEIVEPREKETSIVEKVVAVKFNH